MSKPVSSETILIRILAGSAAVLLLCAFLAMQLGEFFTPTGTISWNPAELGTTVRAGRFQWPAASTWILVVLLLAAFLGALWLSMTVFGAKPEDNGLPRYKDLEHRMGRKAALKQARQALTLPEDASEEDIIVALCKLDGDVLYVQHEDSMWVYAPQRSGKTLWLAVGIVVDAPGPVLTTSTKIDLLQLTALRRRQQGTVEVFDLQDISGWPQSISWDPVAGCEDPDEALARGKAWAGAQPMGDVKNGDWFNSKAAAVLGRFLHAAALDRGDIEDVVRWSNNFSDPEPMEILREHGAPAAFAARLQALTSSRAGETVDSIQETLAGLLEPLSSPKALRFLTPDQGEGFDVETFLAGANTLHLVTDGEDSPVAPLVTMFADHIFRKAQKISQGRAGGRLWPVFTMVLDEAPNVAAFPKMAAALSDSGGRGIRIVGFSQSFAQNRARWGVEGAKAIRGTSSIRIFLPGLEEIDELESIAKAAGPTTKTRTSTSRGRTGTSTTVSEEERPVILAHQIQQLDRGQGFMHYSNLRPAVVDLIPYWDRPDGEQIAQDRKAVERMTGRISA